MYIFNTTFLVSDKAYNVWIKWLHEEHIPFILELGCFVNPQLAKVLFSESDDGTSYSLQFQFENRDALHNYTAQHGERFASEFKHKFGEEVLYFSIVMEIMK